MSTTLIFYSVQCLHHDNTVAANHAHAQAHFLPVRFRLCRFVQDNVKEDLHSKSVY